MNVIRTARRFVVVSFRQIVADRSTLFFMIVLPVAVIVIIGATFGVADRFEIGIVGADRSAAGVAIRSQLEATPGVKVIELDDADALRSAVRRQNLPAGIVLDDDLDQALAGGTADIVVVADEGSTLAMSAEGVLATAVDTVRAPIDAARLAAQRTGATDDEASAAAAAVAASLSPPTVEVVDVGDGREESLSRFSLTAPQNLVLFVFINGMASGAAVVRMRRTGVLRRALAGPVGTGTIVAGVGAAWFVVALVQSLLIVAVGGLLFDVSWGDPVAATLLLVVYAAVGGSAGLLVGAVGADADRVGAISPPLGIALGGLGGCMVPLEVFPDSMRTIAHAIPHYWAMTAWQQLVFDGDGVGAIVTPLLVLTGFAVVFTVAAARAMRRDLVGR
jgi:ABC-2 type transport system permease protein